MWNKLVLVAKKISDFYIDWILSGIGIIDTYLSIYYTYTWQRYVGDNFLEAIVFALVVVVFTVIVFEFAVRQWITLKEDGRRHWSAYILFSMWAIVVLYSITNTISTQYLNVMKDQVAMLEAQGAARVAGVQVPLLEEEIASLDTEIQSYERRKGQLETVLQGVDSVEKIYEWKRTTASVQAQWEEVSGMIREARAKRAELVDQLRVAKTQAKVEELKGAGTDVFAFYAKVLGIKDTSVVHFVLAVFKGVILDLINVICFMLVMLRTKWRNEEHDRAKEKEAEALADPSQRQASGAELLAEAGFGDKAARNGLFVSRTRARIELGIRPVDYDAIVERGIQRGVLKRRGGKVYRASWATSADFLEEIKDVAGES